MSIPYLFSYSSQCFPSLNKQVVYINDFYVTMYIIDSSFHSLFRPNSAVIDLLEAAEVSCLHKTMTTTMHYNSIHTNEY